MTGEGSFISRFALKFFEVLAAGFATAVSGFLVAHFTGFFAAPAVPTAMQPAALQRPAVTQPAPLQGAIGVQPQQPAPTAPAAPAAAAVTTAPAAASPSAMPPTSKPVDTAATETRARDADAAPRNAPEKKPDVAQSLEARVRAALAKANRPAPAEALRHAAERSGNAAPQAPIVASPPRPTEAPTATASTRRAPEVSGRAAEIVPQPAAIPPSTTTMMPPRPAEASAQLAPQAVPVPLAPQAPAIPLAPPATVEIKSQPVAGTDASATAQADASTANHDQDDGPFSSITKFLRSDKPLPEDQAPRPPMPVGQ